ncbi:MAG: DNA polymerase III subunit alpha [Cyclobacteriaceae bacterium]|nr:DNA polymerase III subunit alpha [Cyclobacteriaceae bacterium]MCB0498502.1 DNA polymerase III subunit alpha [Cyclobacteriaceae bacterium]MCB9236931.1 DNA polymerase III subunit alpha [Flammeovirgaceae bacterium]MCO5271466.1 DNA polymerase III subunit alpha [Cyclobacteriaceae bacterium]MCW5901362.1 DNA polymerase III subunit alpha [Cyclobacteriaceae bacterium]
MYLIFDTETTGIPHNKTAPLTDLDNWPRLVQLAWQLHDHQGKLLSQHSYIIQPDGFDIPFKAEQIHGISTQRAQEEGEKLSEVMAAFIKDLDNTKLLIGHNIEFDINIIGAEYIRLSLKPDFFLGLERLDTGIASTEYCQLKGGIGGKLKMPRLNELHQKLFGKDIEDAHDAAYDVDATARSFFGLVGEGVIAPIDGTPIADIHYEEPSLDAGNSTKREKREDVGYTAHVAPEDLIDLPFSHLHTHSQFSVLQATPSVNAIIAKAKGEQQPAVALTDLGNMYGAFKFVTEALKHEIKPIVGCEFFVAEERKKLKFTKDNPDKRYHQVLFAKNKKGYLNLARLSSLGFTEGLYGIYPRIDKALIETHKEGLIASTGGLLSEVPHLILHVGERQAEEAFQWWHQLFKDDFYVELNRHGIPEEDRVNETLLRFCKKHKVKYYAANECYYLQKEESNAHDVLLCIKEGEFKSTPIGSGRGYRYGLPNDEFYFKSQQEMKSLFHDLPEAIVTINEIVNKVEAYDLRQDVLLPKYVIPPEFGSEDDYLRHLTYEGAKKRYVEVTPAITERLDFELETIKKTGYPGYFLIVQDFTNKAREMGVSVGPGRGSAAGSAVAYCIGITNVDPIAYDLLFERFLNPDRISLPDIDIDFDDEGRDKVLQYVIDKYGKNQVAQIITYGTMAAKSSIRDCARVMELPLPDANNLAKLVPERPGTTLEKAFEEVKELNDIKKGMDLRAQVLKQAIVLEGSLRNTGTHACGVIITPGELTSLVPVATARDSEMLVTQFDNSVVESAGMLKMDFLGLTTLSIIRTAIKNIKKRHGVGIDIDAIPLDDKKTFGLYQRGETTGTFQFESEGMQSYLKALKPDKLADLIAMNALYRPGPMEYIPNFIARKRGKEPIKYDLPIMEEFLEDTYGITVYQEQVMLLSQKLANFSKGDADVLRKAMGKKQKEVLDKMKDKFIAGCKGNGHDERVAEKIWKDWEAFAQYAFNKSHSTCYSLVAYQTAYLKANYPAEYMAAVLTHSQNNLDKVTFFIDECRKQNIEVLGPHINESGVFFEVNKNGEIRFGLGAIKGAGEAAVESIIKERESKGPFKNIFEFATRVGQRAVNKKTLECLALSGAFDCFGDFHRRQFVYAKDGDITLTEKLTRYAAKVQQELESAQVSLFGGHSGTEMPLPKVDAIEPFSEIEKLHFEKEVVGVYISGHPLDNFKFEMDAFCNTPLSQLAELEGQEGRETKVGGIVAAVEHRLTKTGKPFGKLMLEDYSGRVEFMLWSEDYLKFKSFLTPGLFLFVEGTVVRKAWGDQSLEFKIRNIELLNELGLKRTKGLQLRMDTAAVSPQMVRQIERLCSEFSGDCPLFLRLQDDQENINLELMSRKYRVRPVNDMVKKIKKIPDLQVEVVL